MELREQVLLGDVARPSSSAIGDASRLDADRAVRGDDHELALGLAPVELPDEPVAALLVERHVPVAVVVGLVVALRVVQHEDSERHAGLRLERVAGEARFRRRPRRSRGPSGLDDVVKNSAHPLRLRERPAVGIGGEHLGRRRRSPRPAPGRRCPRWACARPGSPCRSRGCPGPGDPRRRCRGRGSRRRCTSAAGSRPRGGTRSRSGRGCRAPGTRGSTGRVRSPRRRRGTRRAAPASRLGLRRRSRGRCARRRARRCTSAARCTGCCCTCRQGRCRSRWLLRVQGVDRRTAASSTWCVYSMTPE